MSKLDLPTILSALKSVNMAPDEKARLIVETLRGKKVKQFMTGYERGMGERRYVEHCKATLEAAPTISASEAIAILEGAEILSDYAND